MPKFKPIDGQACPVAFQLALDELDVIGRWEWDATTDLVRADGFVALLFNVDPEEAETGVPIAIYQAGIHVEDRERVAALIRRSSQECSAHLIEYRVISADGRTRWVLTRGRFNCDHTGSPVNGSGILMDITQMRMFEGTLNAVETFSGETPLDRAVDHALAVQEAIIELQDPKLKVLADALLMGLGRKLAQQEFQGQRNRMN